MWLMLSTHSSSRKLSWGRPTYHCKSLMPIKQARNLKTRWRLLWHNTKRCIRTCRRKWSTSGSPFYLQSFQSLPLSFTICNWITVTTFSQKYQYYSSKCQLIASLFCILFDVSFVTLTQFSHKVISLCIVVLPCLGFFRNITPVKGEGLSVLLYDPFPSFWHPLFLSPFHKTRVK